MIDARQSKVIDLLRYPMAVLVVMCHCGFLDGGGTAVQIFFSETLPHVAVPLFLLFSGYLFFKEGRFDGALYWRKLKSRFRTLFIPYIIWYALCFNWLVFNVYVLCIMGATLALAGRIADTKFSDRLIRLSAASTPPIS